MPCAPSGRCGRWRRSVPARSTCGSMTRYVCSLVGMMLSGPWSVGAYLVWEETVQPGAVGRVLHRGGHMSNPPTRAYVRMGNLPCLIMCGVWPHPPTMALFNPPGRGSLLPLLLTKWRPNGWAVCLVPEGQTMFPA